MRRRYRSKRDRELGHQCERNERDQRSGDRGNERRAGRNEANQQRVHRKRGYAKRWFITLRILTAIKSVWGDRATTVFVRQGHYALDPAIVAAYPPADVTIEAIADLPSLDWSPAPD